MIIKARLIVTFSLIALFLSCEKPSSYSIIKNWPIVPEALVMGQVTGVGVNTNDEIIVFPPLYHDKEINGHIIQTYCVESGRSIFDVSPVEQSLSNCLNEFGYNFQAVYCGGDEPVHQQREQWSDGANAFTLAALATV